MEKLKTILSQGALAGALASAASTLVLMWAGRREGGSATAPVNAVSHWFWREEALHHRQPDLKHTAVGYLTHHGAATFWATLYAALAAYLPATRTPAGIVAAGLGTAAFANFADYQLTPDRFKPGYENHLSKTALLAAYAAFAFGLAAGAYAMRSEYRR